MRDVLFVVILIVLTCMGVHAMPAWEQTQLSVTASESLQPALDKAKWETVEPTSKISTVPDPANPDKKLLVYNVTIDHYNEGPYPVGWPSFQAVFQPEQDWSGWDGIQFTVETKADNPSLTMPMRLILPNSGTGGIMCFKSGSKRTMTFRFSPANISDLTKIPRIHFYLDEGEYPHGAHLTFTFSDIRLVKLANSTSTLPAKGAGLELYIGKNSEAVILPAGTAKLNGKTVLYTGSDFTTKDGDKLVYTARELFTNKKFIYTQPLKQFTGSSQKAEINFSLPLKSMKTPAGYYWVTCDLVRGKKSLLDGRVGFEDFYISMPHESMTDTILSLRTGMGQYIIDPLGGYGSGSVQFLHTYDPGDKKYYIDFIKAYKGSTAKHTEGLEAGVTGTVFAAYAFRKAGEIDRARFAEKLLKSNCDYMIKYMQNRDGSISTMVNAYYDNHIGEYDDAASWKYSVDTNQTGEWLRAIARTMIYMREVPEERKYAEYLYNSAVKTADYLVGVTTDQIGDLNHVIRHYNIAGSGKTMKRTLYSQEGRQCDVYLPRTMAGLSYFAYARQLMKGSVPQSYLDALHDTTVWAMGHMKQDTYWFDWQCGYEVEGGCHSFLGNQYLAEATQGYYLLCAARRDVENARLSAECTRRALHFITDYERLMSNNRASLEFWVGPYMYWQFTEYLGSIGKDETFSRYMEAFTKGWVTDHNWKDFTLRTGDGTAFRAGDLCHLTMAIPAYPGLKYLEELGKTFKYPVPSLAELTKN